MPVAGVSYQGKFEGLMDHFGIKNVLIDPEVALDPAALGALVRSVMDRRAEIRDQIQRAFPFLSRMPLENLPWRARLNPEDVQAPTDMVKVPA